MSATTVAETPLWHPQAHMPSVKGDELVLVRGEGSYLWDSTGRRLLDAPASLWYCNVGHGRAEIADAVAAQIRRLEAYSTFGRLASDVTLELAQRVVDMAPVPGGKVFLVSGGSDGIETATKLARRYWVARDRPGKRLVVSRDKGYHGLHAFGTSIGGIRANSQGYGELVADTAQVDALDPQALRALLEERGADAVAAFVCEPVMGTGGVYPPPDGYLDEIQRICREHDVLLIVDEVITGFGRAGAMFASERFGLEPDMLVLAKGITSGYQPLGAVVIGERVSEPFWADGSALSFRHGMTYAGHASACAAALANLDIVEREGLVARVAELEGPLFAALKPLEAHEGVVEVRGGVGLLAGVQLRDMALAERVAAEALERGVLLRVITDATVQVSPPFIVDEGELGVIASALADSLDAVAAQAAV